MTISRIVSTRLGLVAALAIATGVAVLAHTVTYQGTVLAIQTAKVQVKTVDEKTKKEDTVWFGVDKNTKVKRGEKTVKYADAAIAAGERIVVIVDHDAEVKMVATEIRLAAK